MTLFELAQRFVGEVREKPGAVAHSNFIVWCLESCGFDGETPDETPWCSAFVNRLCWVLRMPRTKSARARSWLGIGTPKTLLEAQVGDVVILKRGSGDQPGPEVLDAPGHVGLFAGLTGDRGSHVHVLGGNQADGVSVAPFPVAQVLGVRRLQAGPPAG